MAKSKTVTLDKDTTSITIVTPDATVAIFRIADFLGTQVLVYTDTDKNPDAYVIVNNEDVQIANGTGQGLYPSNPTVSAN